MIIRSLPESGEEQNNSTSPRYSNSSPQRVTRTSARPVTPKLSLHNHPQTSIPSAESIRENAIKTPGSHSSSLGGQSRAGGESQQASTRPSTVLLPSTVTFERSRSLESNPHRDAQKQLRKDSVGFRREREKKRLSFAVGRDADPGSLAETWQIFVDDEELQEAAQLVERDQTAYDPDRYELQSIVAALFDKNAALEHEIANIKADDLATRREKALRHRHIISQKMPGMLDQYDYESDSDLETKLEKDSENYHPWGKEDDNQHLVQTKHNEHFTNRQKSQTDDTASGSPAIGSARKGGRSPIRPQRHERFENTQTSQPSDETSGATSNGPSSKDVERMVELEKQLDDLTKRHIVSRQENLELKKKTRAIQAERDKFKLENFNLQRTRSDAQYEKLREQYQELQVQTQELLRQRQELLDMSNDMVTALPGLKEVQTRNLRALQMYWENERSRAYEQSLAQTAEEGSSSSTDTMKGLAENRNKSIQHARPPLDSISAIEKENLNDEQSAVTPLGKTEVATADGIALRTRQGSTAPVVPGRGLEESRKKGPTPLKQRPGSIIRPAITIRGLPKVASKPSPSYHRLRDPARPHVTPSLVGSSSRSIDVDSLIAADYSGESNGIQTADQIDFARIISQIPPDTPASSAWRDVAGQKYEHQDSPLSGLTPFFEMVKDPPIAFNVKGMIKYDIRGSDSMYNLYEFKKGDYVSVYVDGMHDLWPVKLSEDTRNVVYILPRNSIALVCDHGHEHKTFYEVIKKWDGEKSYDTNSGFLPVLRGERLHCSHSNRMPASTGRSIETFRCMMSEDGKRRGFVPARVLAQLKAFVAPPLTASLCPCADPQPYTGRARVLVDCGEPSGQLSLREGAEVEVSHLETDIAAFCVRDPATERQGFIDATCLRILSNPVHNAPGHGSDDVALRLTPRIFDFRNKELEDMEVLSPEIREAMRIRDGFDGLSEGAKWRWEQNLDSTNPYHKGYDEEMAKRRPDGPSLGKMWRDWHLGPPPSDDYYVLRDDLKVIKSGQRGHGADWNDIKWRTFINTYPFVPLGPGNGTHRARSRSLPARHNPAYISEKEQEREGLMKKPPHIGHQPHKMIADGVCPDRDYMSEPITGEPHNLKRRYIYFNKDGTMRAYEAETETDVHEINLWRTQRKSDKNWTAWRKSGVLVMPVEEDVGPFSFENSIQKSGKAFGYVEALPEQVEAKNQPDPLNVFRTHQKHGFNLVYQLRKDPRTIPALALAVHKITVNDHFEIIEIPGPEMRGVEGYKPTITIRRVKTGSRSEISYGAGTTQEESRSADNTLEGPEYVVSPSDLHTMPFLRTAFMKGEQMLDCLMPQEREILRFVLIRSSMQGPIWDALHEGRIVSTKLSMMELEDPRLWKSLDSVLGQIKHAYQQKEVMNALEKEKDTEREPTSTPREPQIDEWDFWYPIIQDHTKEGLVDVKGPDLATGRPVEYVQVIPDSEESGTYMCSTLDSNQFGLVNAKAIDLNDPHLLMFPYLNPIGNPPDVYFFLLKDENNKFFISSEHHAKGWIDHRDLPFNEKSFDAVPLWKLFRTGILNIDNFEGAETYMEEVYNNEPVGEQQKPSDATPPSKSREMTGGPLGENTGQRSLLNDSPGPPASLYCPRSVSESVMPAAPPNTEASTRSQGKSRSDHLSDAVAQTIRRSLPADIAITQDGTGEETQQPTGSGSTSENSSDLSMIELHVLGGGGTSKAPAVPIQTKPTQNSKKSTSRSTKSEDVTAVLEPETENAEDDITMINPHDNNELVISYNDWVKREEAYKDDTSTENRQNDSGWLRKSRSVERDASGQNAEMRSDEVANVEHRSLASTRDSDNTHASRPSQPGVRFDNPKKEKETNPDRQSKRRRSKSDQSIDDSPDPSRKRTRSTMKSVSNEDSIRELTTGADTMENKKTSPSRGPSELADGTIRGTSFSHVDASRIPIGHSPVVPSHGRPSEAPADVSSTRFPSLHGVGRSSLSQKDRFESDYPYTPDDAEGPPNREISVAGSRRTSVLDSETTPSLSGGRWNGRGQAQVNHPLNSNNIHSSPRGITPHLGNEFNLRDPRPKITTRTMSSCALLTSIDSRDSGVRLYSDDDENTDVVTPSDITKIGNCPNSPNLANHPITHIDSSPSNAHQLYTELAGSPVSPVRTRFPPPREPPRTHQPIPSTSHLQTTANIHPTNPPTQLQQPLAILPAKTTTLTICPIRSPTLSDLEPTQWLNEKLTLLIELFLSINSPASTPTLTTRGSRAGVPETRQTAIESGSGPGLRKISRWRLLYFLSLGYLLLSMWIARAEWLNANGRGGIWGVQAVRGGHGRWVWGLYTG